MWHIVSRDFYNGFHITVLRLGNADIYKLYARRYVPGICTPIIRWKPSYPGYFLSLEELRFYLDRFNAPLRR